MCAAGFCNVAPGKCRFTENATTAEQLRTVQQATRRPAACTQPGEFCRNLAHPDCHYDWVRPGIMLYGSSPFADKTAEELDLSAVMSLQSEIISVKHLQQGDAVGYGGTWICPEDMRIAVVACGYGDGYPRHAPAGTPVMVAGKLTAVDWQGIDGYDYCRSAWY